MANREHVEKLVNSTVAGWNEWRKANPREKPDLSGVDINQLMRSWKGMGDSYPVDLTGIDLSEADLSRTTLERCILDEANLTDSIMRDCTLDKSSFRDAILVNADLSGSSMLDAQLDGAELVDANLAGTDVDGSRLWRSKLFGSSEVSVPISLKESPPAQLTDLQSFMQCLDDLADGLEEEIASRAVRLYFRGEEDSEFVLQPSVMRKSELRENEDRLMSDLSIRRPAEFDGDALYFQRLVMARHFELPTRLLDVTRDPLVALYYAAAVNHDLRDGILRVFWVPDDIIRPFDSDTVSLLANFSRLEPRDKDILLTLRPICRRDPRSGSGVPDYRATHYDRVRTRLNHFIAQEKPYWQDRIDPKDFFKVLFVEPQRRFDRLRAHSGAFMMSAYHERFEKREVQQRVAGAAPYEHLRIGIPHKAKDRIREQLDALGVNEERLRADLESSAKAVAEMYRSKG